MPDYVKEEGKFLVCTLCPSKANAIPPMYNHLGGTLHSRRCRSSGNEEVVFIKLRGQLEYFSTGKPVLRSGFKIPRPGDEMPAPVKRVNFSRSLACYSATQRKRVKAVPAARFFTRDVKTVAQAAAKQMALIEAQAAAEEESTRKEGADEEKADVDGQEEQDAGPQAAIEATQQSSEIYCMPCMPSSKLANLDTPAVGRTDASLAIAPPPDAADEAAGRAVAEDASRTKASSSALAADASQTQVHEAAGVAPYPLPSREPPQAGTASGKQPQVAQSASEPPCPAPARKPPPAPTRAPPAAKPPRPRVNDLPEELLGTWSFWTTPEASNGKSAVVPTPAPTRRLPAQQQASQSSARPPAPSRPTPAPPARAPPTGDARLPGDWLEQWDAKSGCVYYYSRERQASQWERPRSKGAAVALALPPGWIRKWCDSQGRWFYVDLQLQTSQWELPEPYVHRDWRREVDETGRGYLTCSKVDNGASDNEVVYEQDKAWERYVDLEDRIYWSCASSGVRFFEASPA